MTKTSERVMNESVVQQQLADAKQQGRNKHWSQLASYYLKKWDHPGPESALYKELESKLLIDATSAGTGKKILDLCCGTGRNTVALAQTGAEMFGIDGAQGMLEQARQHAIEQGVASAEFRQGDSRSLPFPDNMFDGVTGTRFMYMMRPDEKRQIIREVHRVLKPGGRAAIQFNCGLWGIKQEFFKMCNGSGFRIRSRYFWPGQAQSLFEGFDIEAIVGVKIPRLALASRLMGRRTALAINRTFRWPILRHLSAYAVVVASCRK